MSNNLIGWKEWCRLESLTLPAVKAKIDTGAKTSCLHAFNIEKYNERGNLYINFSVHPLQKRSDIIVKCEALVHDERIVSDSGGHKELRYVIKSPVSIGGTSYDIELTLTDRESMKYRMLLGRAALLNKFIVDVSKEYVLGTIEYNELSKLYNF